MRQSFVALLSPSGSLGSNRRARTAFAAKFKNQVHDLVFNLVAGLHVNLVALPEWIQNLPFARGNPRIPRQVKAAHIHDKIELFCLYGIEPFGEMARKNDGFLT